MGLSRTLRAGQSGLGRAIQPRSRRAPRRRYLAATALTAGGLLLLAVPVIALRRRSGSSGDEPELLDEVTSGVESV